MRLSELRLLLPFSFVIMQSWIALLLNRGSRITGQEKCLWTRSFSGKQYNPTYVEKDPPYTKNPAWPGNIGSPHDRPVFRSTYSCKAWMACQ